jgi:UDP-N-acetylglucosamine--N-acetylmuramyl-(pentapeptide) pyrophosphoryl-undecaprenol N-acetylglucosamine transferase
MSIRTAVATGSRPSATPIARTATPIGCAYSSQFAGSSRKPLRGSCGAYVSEMVVLLVASGGGHLKELHTLLPRLMPDEERLWLTFDNPNSRSLLAGENVQYVPYVHPRDFKHLLENVRLAISVVRRLRPTAAISTGSGVALAWLPVAAAHGAEAHFIETATRTDGPSICGKVLIPMPRVNVYSQSRLWAGGRVRYGGSVFDGFVAVDRGSRPVRKVLVTVGSNESYGFERLIRRLIHILPPGAEVIWQIGCSQVPELGDAGKVAMPTSEIVDAHSWADVVVAHAGVGSATTALENGRMPVLVPRRKAHTEHIDDHQTLIAEELGRAELAVVMDADDLTMADLENAARYEMVRNSQPPAFDLAR